MRKISGTRFAVTIVLVTSFPGRSHIHYHPKANPVPILIWLSHFSSACGSAQKGAIECAAAACDMKGLRCSETIVLPRNRAWNAAGTPFRDISEHVVQAPGIRNLATHGVQPAAAISGVPAHFIQWALLPKCCRAASPAGVFPLCLCRKSVLASFHD